MPNALSSPFPILCTRPGIEEWLLEEAYERLGLYGKSLAPGRVTLEGTLPKDPFVFEWQRLPESRFFTLAKGERPSEGTLESIWSFFTETPKTWALQVVPPPEDAEIPVARVNAVARDLIKGGKRLHPDLLRWERKVPKIFRTPESRLLQLSAFRNGFVISVASPDQVTSSVPGGELRMKMDPAAPSRSYLKIEEAFYRMGREPKEGETAIDLGAAPGGWSYAFAKRGALVTAVDNGPLKIEDACIRRIDHVHADGLTFRLSKHQPPVDWLAGDMLIPPGDAFGLLKHWVGGHHCKYVVLNLKLPQQHPISALSPILDWLESRPGLQIRQLCHDRKEVTVFGEV